MTKSLIACLRYRRLKFCFNKEQTEDGKQFAISMFGNFSLLLKNFMDLLKKIDYVQPK